MSLTCLWLVCFEGPVVIFHCSSESQAAKVEEQHEAKGVERSEWMTGKPPVSRELVTRCSQELSAMFS